MSHIIIILLAIAVACSAATITLPVTQDYVVANAGHGLAAVQTPNELNLFSNGFQSSVTTFGVELSGLAIIDRNTIASAQLKFNNFNLTRGESVSIGITYLNPGQNFDENTVTLNTQPTSASTLGSVLFSENGAVPIEVKNQLVESLIRGGLFGFRIDLPGGPVSVASHRLDPQSVVIEITTGEATTTTSSAPSSEPDSTTPATTTTTTAAPVPGAPTTTTAAPIPGAPTTTTARPAPGAPITTTARPATTTTARPGTPTTSAAPGTPTTSAAPGTPTTGTLPGTTSAVPPVSAPPSSTEQARSASGKTEVAVIMCIVPLIVALLL